MAQFILSLPLWQLIRTLGIVSYVLITIGISLGLIYTFPWWNAARKADAFEVHTFFTNTGMLLGILHGIITVIDPYMPFSWSEVLVPFTAQHSPILNGLGTLAAYSLLLIIFTSDIRHLLARKVWHLMHLLSYPVFVMSFIHGYFVGTDTGTLGWMYLISVLIVLILTGIRVALVRAPKTNTAPHS
ncbi:ferric reductase [Paradesulfitobacterium ferrireducens]|uniref:ferric reductase n=1 Tax=Paradesulfitobacterium ferrireducens TaxID=2816476 RepID=UPI001A8FADEB|nr:ferric reductase [Paradesulfitobacterium ferrireducens]